MSHYDVPRPPQLDHDYQPDGDMVCSECGWGRGMHSPSALEGAERLSAPGARPSSGGGEPSTDRHLLGQVSQAPPLETGGALAHPLTDVRGSEFFWLDACYADAMSATAFGAVWRWFVRNIPFRGGRGSATGGDHPEFHPATETLSPGREAPSEPELGCIGRCMGMHTEEMVCLETERARRRAGLLTVVRRRDEQAMEASALALERCSADIPEFTTLRACHEGARNALLDFGSAMAQLIQADVPVPTEMMVAQTELSGVTRSLAALLVADVAENRDHRGIVTALRGDRDGE